MSERIIIYNITFYDKQHNVSNLDICVIIYFLDLN